MWFSARRARHNWLQTFDKNEQWLSERLRKKHYKEYVSTQSLKYSNPRFFRTAFLSGVITIYCLFKWLDQNTELAGPPKKVWSGLSAEERLENKSIFSKMPLFIEQKLGFNSQEDFDNHNYDLEIYDDFDENDEKSTEKFVTSKTNYSDLLLPIYSILFFKNYRQFGPIRSSIRSLYYTGIYGVIPSLMNYFEILPWQVYRKVIVESRYLEWTKRRDDSENIQKRKIIFDRILEECHTNRSKVHSVETEVFNTLVPSSCRDVMVTESRYLNPLPTQLENKYNISWHSCYDYEDLLKEEAEEEKVVN